MINIFSKLCFLFLLLPSLGYAALPKSSSVPGGVAVVPLTDVSATNTAPQAWLGKQPVLVTADENKWYAVVGLSLSTAPGSYTLQIKVGDKSTTQDFEVSPKAYPEQHITIKDKGKVQLSAANEARAKREIAEIMKLKRHWRTAPNTDPAFDLPAEGKLSSRFGLRRFFNGEPRSPHVGLDVAIPGGTPINASSQGEVIAVGDYFFNGKTVFLDHGNGLITMYCHLDRIDVKPKNSVRKGQPIGLSGQTGRASGPHLHWSVVLNGTMVDPELFIAEKQIANPN